MSLDEEFRHYVASSAFNFNGLNTEQMLVAFDKGRQPSHHPGKIISYQLPGAKFRSFLSFFLALALTYSTTTLYIIFRITLLLPVADFKYFLLIKF